MKKLLIWILLLAPFFAAAQIPSVTGNTRLKFQEGDNVWLAPIDSLLPYFAAGAGTVTSVNVSGGTTGVTTSGGPITTAGTITLSGTLVAGHGGTGQSSYTVGDILFASGSTSLSKLAGVATGNALISGGVATAPSWGKIGLTTHVTGTLPVGNGGTGLSAVGGAGTLLGSNGSANVYLSPTITTNAAAIAYSLNGSNIELNLPNADATNRGTVSTTTQTFAGAKTWTGLNTFNVGTSSTASATAAAYNANGVTASNWTAMTSTTSVTETHSFIEIGTLSANITLNLPACNATRNGWEWDVLKVGTDAFGVILDPTGSEQFVDGALTKTVYSQGNGAKCKCKWNGSTGTWYFLTQM